MSVDCSNCVFQNPAYPTAGHPGIQCRRASREEKMQIEIIHPHQMDTSIMNLAVSLVYLSSHGPWTMV